MEKEITAEMKFEVGQVYELDGKLFRVKKIIFKDDGSSPIIFEEVDQEGNIVIQPTVGYKKDLTVGVRVIFDRLNEMKEFKKAQ